MPKKENAVDSAISLLCDAVLERKNIVLHAKYERDKNSLKQLEDKHINSYYVAIK